MCRKSLCHKRQPNSSGTFFYAVRTTTASGFYRESKKGCNRHSYNFRPKHFDSVKFNPTRHFVKEVYRKGEKELEHADHTYGFKTSSSKHTQEERFGMLMEYLREYTFITRQEYPVLLYPMIDFIERNPAPFSPNAFVPIPYAARYNHIDACPMGQLQ